ncbi:MAG TPA: hypothetical protein VHW69_12710 [Rhizomicrobium sp.]|nr:hypothetical protein [Rhizomicrobium sp.]
MRHSSIVSTVLLAASVVAPSVLHASTTNVARHLVPAAHRVMHPGSALVREFVLMALPHLKGPTQLPFLNLLKTLPPATKQPGVTISTKATKNVQCSGGVCTPTAAIAVLNVSDLTRLLGDGSVTIATTAQAPDIFVNAPFSWASANGLTFQAIGNVTLNKRVSDAGPAPLTLTYNATGAGGALSFGNKGSINFLSAGNPLTINGQGYILANNIQFLAQVIARNPSGNFALSASYNAKPDGKYTQSPIPTLFQGNFEGLGNTISNLHLDASGQLAGGLFQQIGPTSYVANLRLHHLNLLTINSTTAGGFAAENDGTIFDVAVDSNTTVAATFSSDGDCFAGGLVGLNTGTISFSNSLATVQVDYESGSHCAIGGLIGYTKSNVDHSFAGQGTVSESGPGSQYSLGGLIGVAGTDVFLTPNITASFATGAVASTASTAGSVGGFIGSNLGQFCCGSASVANSSASGPVTGGSVIGGFVGANTGVIDDAVATGAVSSSICAQCGGFAGLIVGGGVYSTSISDSTSFGSISGPGLAGGFVGQDQTPQDIFNSGWCTTSSGFTDIHHGAGDPADDAGIAPFTC